MAFRILLRALGIFSALWFAAAPRVPSVEHASQACALVKASLCAIQTTESFVKKSNDGKWEPSALAARSPHLALCFHLAIDAGAALPGQERSRAPFTTRQSRAPPAA